MILHGRGRIDEKMLKAYTFTYEGQQMLAASDHLKEAMERMSVMVCESLTNKYDTVGDLESAI